MAGRPAVYSSAAQRQAAYRARKAGRVLDLSAETFEETLSVLTSLIDKSDEPSGIETNLRALVDAMKSKDGYTWWKLERQRRAWWGR